MSMFDRIVEYASRQLEIPAEEITRDTTFESLGVDSLDIVEMTMDFEAELGVELDPQSATAGMNSHTRISHNTVWPA